MRKLFAKEIIFEAEIDFGYNLKNKGVYLTDQHQQYESKKVPTRSEVSECAYNVISTDLPNELELIYGIKIKTRIITTRPGSLELFFGVLFTGYSLIGWYKSLLDSIDLIKRHGNRILSSKFKDRFDIKEWSIEIQSRYPSFEKLRSRRNLKELLMHGDIDEFEDFFLSRTYEQLPRKKRDGFFYYLIVANCILLIILGLLAFAAIQKTYFP